MHMYAKCDQNVPNARYRTLTIYNVFLRAIMADNTNTPGVAAPKKGNIKGFNVLFRCSYSAIF